MGWNQLEPRAHVAAARQAWPRSRIVYFAHSYYVPGRAADRGHLHLHAALHRGARTGNVFGVQFHPEKSGPLGLQIVRNFVEL